MACAFPDTLATKERKRCATWSRQPKPIKVPHLVPLTGWQSCLAHTLSCIVEKPPPTGTQPQGILPTALKLSRRIPRPRPCPTLDTIIDEHTKTPKLPLRDSTPSRGFTVLHQHPCSYQTTKALGSPHAPRRTALPQTLHIRYGSC